MGFFDMGFLEILVIAVVALLVVGPDRLPGYARKFGKMMRDLRKMTKNLTGEMTRSLDLEEEADDLKKTAQELKGSLDAESLKIKNALDLEADEIARTIDTEVKGVKKTIDDGTTDLAAMLEKESLEFDKTTKEIKTSLDGEARELNKTLNEGVTKLNETLNIDNNKVGSEVKPAPADRGNTRSKKTIGETPEALDTVETPVPEQSGSSPAQVTENPAEKKAGSEEVGI